MNASPNDLLARLGDHPDLVVEITTGTEHWMKGLVVLALHGDGRAEIVNRRAGAVSRFEHRLAPAAVAALGAEFAKAGFTAVKSPPGPREPGDSPVVLRLIQGGKTLHDASLWNADRYDLPALETILSRYDAIVGEATNGDLPY